MDLGQDIPSQEQGERSKQIEEHDRLPVASTSTSNSVPSADVPPRNLAPAVNPIIHLVPPHGAIVFKDEDGLMATSHVGDIGDDFFDLSIDEVKSRQRELRAEVKRLEEGGQLLTRELREQRLRDLRREGSCS